MWKKYLHLKKTRRTTFNSRKNLLFFLNPTFIKVNLLTCICPTRNCQLFFRLTHWNYFKCKNWLLTLNIYKIHAKELHLVDRWATDEVSVSQILFWKYLGYVQAILSNYKQLKSRKIVRFTICSFLSVQYLLLRAAQ